MSKFFFLNLEVWYPDIENKKAINPTTIPSIYKRSEARFIIQQLIKFLKINNLYNGITI
jgi:hypothetical protein